MGLRLAEKLFEGSVRDFFLRQLEVLKFCLFNKISLQI